MRIALLVVGIVGCGGTARSTSPSPEAAGSGSGAVIGTPADARTRDGDQDGYRVTHACRDRDCIGVIGTGAQWWPGMERSPIVEERFRASFDQFRRDVLAAIEARGVRSVHASGLGGACSDGGLVLQLASWRDVDASIEAAGTLLRDKAVRETIGICVSPDSAVLIDEQRAPSQ